MKQKISILLLLCVAILLPSIATAQEFNIFAKQKVVVADIRDVNDRHLSDGVKKVIRNGIVDACVKSDNYDIIEINLDDIKRQIASKGERDTFLNICKAIGSKADYIIFTNVKLSSSEVGAQNVTIYITSSLYRIATAAEVRTSIAEAAPISSSILSATSNMVSELLDVKSSSKSPQNPECPTSQNNTEYLTAEQTYNKGLEYYKSRNYSESIKFFESAAKLGYAAAQCYLGVSYYYGRGVVKDYINAALWYSKAAEQGYANAQNSLGICYSKGHGVIQSDVEATNWYRRAAEQGNKVAQHNLAFQYKNGRGVAQDFTEAARWYRKAAEQGYAKAQNSLGNCYRKGEGVAQDFTEAARWYHKAAEQGYAKAQNSLGNCYRKGEGVEQDYKTAIYWYELAASKNYSYALYNLGLCYEKGLGVVCNIYKAKTYYEKAAEKGHEGAKKKLQNL